MDIQMGVIVTAMAFFLYHPASGYSAINIIAMVLIFAVAYVLFWIGKKYITIPRLGQVRFGQIRQAKKTTLAIILGVIVLIQGIVVALTAVGWANPSLVTKLFGQTASTDLERMVVAAVGAFFVGPSMLIIAYFNDFPRGFYIAVLMALAVFLMIWINQPIYPAVIGGLIIVPGLVLFIRFLVKYPLKQGDQTNG